VLLHADLHHDNILSAGGDDGGRWLAIDPHGLAGEPSYEVGALLRNFWPERHTLADPRRTTERRIRILAEQLGFERERIRDWALAQAVLSAWWCVEDGGDFEPEILAPAEIIASAHI
jgi:streptomycin 6-kinase